MNANPPRTPAERFAGIMESVYQALAAQGLRGVLTGPLLILVCAKLRRAAARVTLIAAKLQAGTLRRRPPRERAARSRREPPPEPENPPKKPLLPQAFGWLPRMVQAVCFGRSQLTYLLAQPDMVALIEAAPPIAHHLRPICRMLGVKPPPGLFLQRRRRRKATAPTPKQAAPAPAKKRKPSRRRPASEPADPFPSFAPPPRKRPPPAACGPPRLG